MTLFEVNNGLFDDFSVFWHLPKNLFAVFVDPGSEFKITACRFCGRGRVGQSEVFVALFAVDSVVDIEDPLVVYESISGGVFDVY